MFWADIGVDRQSKPATAVISLKLLHNAQSLKYLDKRVKIKSPNMRPGILSKPTSSPAAGAYPIHLREYSAVVLNKLPSFASRSA